jgi:hypothetical protein
MTRREIRRRAATFLAVVAVALAIVARLIDPKDSIPR